MATLISADLGFTSKYSLLKESPILGVHRGEFRKTEIAFQIVDGWSDG